MAISNFHSGFVTVLYHDVLITFHKMTSLSPYCIMMGTMMQCRHLCPGRARVPSASEPPQHAGGQRRRRGLGAEPRSSATKRLGCTPQLTHQTFIFPAGRWRTYPGFQAPCGRLHRQDFSVSPAPMLSSSHHEIACKFLSKRERERLLANDRTHRSSLARRVCSGTRIS